VFTYIGNKLAVAVAPNIFIDSDLDVYAYLGASLVILGAMTTSIGGKQKVTVLNDSA
jgi:hypothetical protein